MPTLTGKCLCGAIRFTATGVSMDHNACHCEMCRRWSGGAPFFATKTERIDFEGVENLGRYASSEWAERGFCKECGTALFYLFKASGTYMMSVGTFDDTTQFRLSREICIDRKPDGYALAGDHPRLTEAETFSKMTSPPE